MSMDQIFKVFFIQASNDTEAVDDKQRRAVLADEPKLPMDANEPKLPMAPRYKLQQHLVNSEAKPKHADRRQAIVTSTSQPVNTERNTIQAIRTLAAHTLNDLISKRTDRRQAPVTHAAQPVNTERKTIQTIRTLAEHTLSDLISFTEDLLQQNRLSRNDLERLQAVLGHVRDIIEMISILMKD